MLFVDTSHVVKTGGDVPWIFNQVLPRLRRGVVVHLHDIFLPWDYPQDWVFTGKGWNEQYLVAVVSRVATRPSRSCSGRTGWSAGTGTAMREAFPELAEEDRATLVAVDPARLARNKKRGPKGEAFRDGP